MKNLSHSLKENEAPRSKLRGIKAEFAVAIPAYALSSFGGFALPFIPAVPLQAGQGIQAKANKKPFRISSILEGRFQSGTSLRRAQSSRDRLPVARKWWRCRESISICNYLKLLQATFSRLRKFGAVLHPIRTHLQGFAKEAITPIITVGVFITI